MFCLLTASLALPVRSLELGDAVPPEQKLGSDLDGAPVTLESLGGRPGLLVFWASWCRDCAKELPTVEALLRRWSDRFTILGVSGDATRRDLVRFLRKNYELLTFRVSHDPGRRVARTFGVYGIPTSVLIDAEGVMRWRRVGYSDTWLKELSDVLAPIVRAQAAKAE